MLNVYQQRYVVCNVFYLLFTIIHISKTQKQRMAVNHYIKTNNSPSIIKNEVIWLLREWNLEKQFIFTGSHINKLSNSGVKS